MTLRHGHHRQIIYEVSLAGPPEHDRLVGVLQTVEDAERIVRMSARIAELEAENARLRNELARYRKPAPLTLDGDLSIG